MVDIMHQVRKKKLLRNRKKIIVEKLRLFFVQGRAGEVNEEEVVSLINTLITLEQPEPWCFPEFFLPEF